MKAAETNIMALMDALNCSPLCRRRDACGTWIIEGKGGYIYDQPEGFYLFCSPGSARAWGFAKKALDFCTVTQDGDDEGFLVMRDFPTPEQAVIIRDKLGIRKRREMSEAELERLRATAFKKTRVN
jgi:hypothetical protein